MDNNDNILSEIKSPEIEVSFLQGFLIRLIDFIIDITILFLIYLLMPPDVFQYLLSSSPFVRPAIVLVVIIVHRIIFLMLFSKTIGMMVCSAKLLNKDLQPLSPSEKLLSIFRTRFSAIKYYKDK